MGYENNMTPDANRQAFMKAWKDITEPAMAAKTGPMHRLFNNAVILEVLDDTNGRRPLRPNQVELADMKSLAKRQGKGSEALEKLTSLADQFGIDIILEAVSLGTDNDDPGDYELKQYYKKFGFTSAGTWSMYREAVKTPERTP